MQQNVTELAAAGACGAAAWHWLDCPLASEKKWEAAKWNVVTLAQQLLTEEKKNLDITGMSQSDSSDW